MPEQQQIQQSKDLKHSSQKRAIPANQTHILNPAAIIQRARINPKSLTPADFLQLQRTIGNSAVGRLLSEIRNPSMVQQMPIQRQELEEEESCPSCVQRQETSEEDEILQGKMSETIQRLEPEEQEKLQTKSVVQRQENPEEDEEKVLQAKMIDTVQRHEPEEEEPHQTKRDNNTGMPDNLKADVESLSGIDMSDVRVHYNSSKPAEVGALAYTQGTSIHVAPGQERHLPHEAWHVVQQAQGRVQPTMQLKDGVPVNDEEGLEQEANAEGARALEIGSTTVQSGRSTPVQCKVIQLQRYIRGCKSKSDFDKDMEYLNKVSTLHRGEVDLEINNWLEGSGWSSSTRYNEGQRHYYSPIGIVFDVKDDAKVLGNFSADGNTSTLKSHHEAWWKAFEDIRKAMNSSPDEEWLKVKETIRNKTIATQKDAEALRDAIVNLFETSGVSPKIVGCLQKEGRRYLIMFYTTHRRSNDPQNKRMLGPGINPAGLSEAERAILNAPEQVIKVPPTTEIRYTESVLNVTFDDVEGSYYNTEKGTYSSAIDGSLSDEKRWMENRITMATYFKDRLGKSMFAIKNGKLDSA